MFRFKTVLTGLILLAGTCGSVSAQVIADYRVDYLSGTFNGQTRPAVSADGWDYMWNANAAIGTAAGNYSSLMAWGTGYNLDGAGGLPRANPAGYVSLDGTGGHPGRGQTQGGTWDRYAITAYTIQSTEGGLIQVANSAISVGSGASTGVELRVYVNDGLTTSLVRSGGGVASSFDGLLGIVNPGDTVYVAMGPNLDDGSDGFNVAYQLDTVTDPLVVVWDADGTLPINGGTGGWDTTSSRWYTGSGGGMYTTWNNAAGMNANFLATGGAVNLDVPITARSLTFSADGYTVTGANALTLTSAGSGGPGPNTIDVTGEGATATISAPITGGSLTKVGGGTLVLTGNNTYLGATKIDGGVLTVNGIGAITQTDRLHNRVGGVTLNVANSASITARNYMVLGDYSGASITVNQSGGTVTNLGTANNPGGNNVANRWGHWGGGNTTYSLSSGDLNLLNAPLYLSWDGDAALNVQGGTANIVGINMGYGGRTHNSTINLTSGTLNIGSGGIYTGGTANKNINLGGGTLAASANWSSSMPMALTGTGGRVRVDTNGNTITLSGDLTGAGGLTKIDDGTLTLSGNTVTMNDYFYVANGTVNLNGSTVTANAGTQIADRSQDNVNPINAVLNINTGSSLTTRFIVGGNGGGANINGTINQYAGTTVETTGVTAENNGLRLGHYPGGDVTYNLMGGTLTIGDNRDLSAATDGTGWFNQTGGTLNVNRIVVNKRAGSGGSGRVTLAGGTANIGAGGIITDSDPSKATLKYGGLGATVRATASFSSPLDATLSGTGANAIRFDPNGNTITLSGALSGTGQLHKVGAGTLSLTGNNTLASLVVDGGATSVLEIAGSSNTSVAGYVGIGDASFATLRIKDTAQFSPSQLLVGESNGIGGAVEHQGGTVTIAGETRIGHWPNETSTYTLDGGSLIANGNFAVGWDGTGVFNVNGGTAQFNNGLKLGDNAGPGGTVNMTDGSITTIWLGLGEGSGTPGTFNQSGGTVTVTSNSGENAAIRVGHWANATSTYNLSDGILNITDPNADLAIGTDGTGIFHQTGGEANLPGVQVNHRNAGGSGTLIVEGPGEMNIGGRGLKIAAGTATLGGSSVTTVTGSVSVGDWGFGGTSTLAIRDTATLHANGAEFMLGDSDGVPGAVGQTGGTVNISGRIRIGHWPNETSTYNMTAGTLNASGELFVGWDGIGDMDVTGGNVSATNGVTIQRNSDLTIGGNATFGTNLFRVGDSRGSGTLNIQGSATVTASSLSAGDDTGDMGTVNQSGGTFNISNLCRIGHYPGNTSTYTLSDGELNLTGTPSGVVNPGGVGEQNGILYLGVDGTGVFTQTGGTADAHGIVLDARGNTSGTDTFTLEGGTVIVGPSGIKSGNLDANTSYQINLGGGTVSASADWASALAMTLTGTGGHVTFDTDGHNITLSGLLSGPGGMTKVGPGTLAITGTNNSYSGPTTVNGGVLAANTAMLYPNAGWASRAITVNNGGVLEVGGWADGDTLGIGRVSFEEANIVIDGGTIRYTGSTTTGRPDRGFTIGAGGATLDASGGNEWHIQENRPQFSIVSSQGGLLTLTGTTNGRISKNIPGTGALVKNGTGTWTLTYRNTYTGDTTVNDGTLVLNAPNAANSTIGPGTLFINPGATVDTYVNGFGWTYQNPIVIDGGTLRSIGADSHLNTVTMTAGLMTGQEFRPHLAITTNAAAASAVIDVATLRLYGTIPFNVADGAAAIDLDVTGRARGDAVRKTGPGTMRMTRSDNDYSGGTVVDGGTLRLAGQNNGQSTVGTGTITINAGAAVTAESHNVFGHTSRANIPHVVINGGTLTPYQYLHVADVDMTGGTIEAGPAGGDGLQTHASVFTTHASADTATVRARVQAAYGDVTFDVADGPAAVDFEVAGQIHGGNNILKIGPGTTLVSHANNTFTGATMVNAGTLLVDGDTTASSGTPVAAGATLGGTGAVAPISGAGLVSPGHSPGILASPSVDPSGGLDFAFEFTATGSPDYTDATQSINDVLRLTDPSAPFAGPLGAENVVDVYLDVTDLSLGDTFRGGFYTDRGSEFLAEIDDGTFNIWVAGDGGGSQVFGGKNYYAFEDLSLVGDVLISTVPETGPFATGSVDGYVMQLSAVPEPSTLVLAALGLLGLGLAGWRRRRRRS